MFLLFFVDRFSLIFCLVFKSPVKEIFFFFFFLLSLKLFFFPIILNHSDCLVYFIIMNSIIQFGFILILFIFEFAKIEIASQQLSFLLWENLT